MANDLLHKDLQYIWHPFTPQPAHPEPILITRGEGSLLIDQEGRSYIDAISSWWVNLHGHAHPYIAEKIYQQALTLEQVIFAGFTHRPAIELAERILKLLPGDFSRVFYSDNGSTATEVALKMAIQYWWNVESKISEVRSEKYKQSGSPSLRTSQILHLTSRKKIMAFRDAYHGDTFGAMSVSDRGVFTMAFHELLFDVIFLDRPTPENIDDIKALVQHHGPSTACFIYEPLVQGAGGMKTYDAALLNELLNTMKAQEIICIADEVMTGFGRTGKLFASAYMHCTPDIICLSKGLTGGTMALGLTACTDHIYKAYLHAEKKHSFFHGHSFTANPLACTAALASLDLLERETCTDQIAWISRQQAAFTERLRNNANIYPKKIRNPRSIGTIAAFEISQGPDGYLNDVSRHITETSMDKGVYLRPLGNTLYTMPPYCITNAEMSTIHQTILEILEAL
jgi:adenosylmethionine-8-amino-7-oxononanoate aminotransferase